MAKAPTKPTRTRVTTKADSSIKVMSREEVKALMEQQARTAFGTSARDALISIRSGELPNTLKASNLSMLNSLLKYGSK